MIYTAIDTATSSQMLYKGESVTDAMQAVISEGENIWDIYADDMRIYCSLTDSHEVLHYFLDNY